MSVVEMKVPTVGESVTEVTLSEWMVKEGDYVEMDQPICEFESDKATLEFPAEAAGVIEFVANEGDDLEIGDLVAKIDTSAEKSSTSESSEEDESAELLIVRQRKARRIQVLAKRKKSRTKIIRLVVSHHQQRLR